MLKASKYLESGTLSKLFQASVNLQRSNAHKTVRCVLQTGLSVKCYQRPVRIRLNHFTVMDNALTVSMSAAREVERTIR